MSKAKTTAAPADRNMLDEEFSDTDMNMTKMGTVKVEVKNNIQEGMDSILEKSLELAEHSREVNNNISPSPQRRKSKTGKSKSPAKSRDNSVVRESN
jgi:hypothetical protein